ncbi:hypothetical protein NKH09_29435 [Mesorhizobium sp. M1339]|uniref:hypothetical protein n=1 Tax=Mesorhizobium sp. M1339 TaxID=2957086 RepID=UPI00333500D1
MNRDHPGQRLPIDHNLGNAVYPALQSRTRIKLKAHVEEAQADRSLASFSQKLIRRNGF